MSEFEPNAEHDLFLDDLSRYMRDVHALETDGEAEIDNNSFRLTSAFYDLLEKLGVSDTAIIEKMNTTLPISLVDELGFTELVLQYKLAPLRLLNQRQPDCVLPLELLSAKRIETLFNYALAGEEIKHSSCITGDEQGKFACEHSLTCPIRLGRAVGKDLLGLFVVQRHLHEDDIESKDDPAFFNLLQLGRTLTAHQLLFPTEVSAYTNLANRYVDEQMLNVTRPDSPRTNDETNDG